MGPEDVEDGLRLCRATGGNQRAEDWQAMLAHGSFRVAVRGDRVVGSAGAVVYGRRLAWVAMVLVDPAERRQGIGTGLVEDVVSRLGHVEIVGLDATPAGAAVYAPLGFADRGGLVRMERPPGPAGVRAAADLRHPTAADLAAVGVWDLTVFGADRTPLLRWALDQAPEYAWAAIGPHGPRGYVFGRHGHRTEHVGPLVAEDDDTAAALLQAVAATSPASAFTLDVPDNASWLDRLNDLGFEAQRPFRRMILGDRARPGDVSATYAVFGPELG